MKKIIIAASAALFTLSACVHNGIKGSGHMASRNFAKNGFMDVDVHSAMRVHLKQGPDYKVRIDAEDNILDLIRVRTEGDKLVIDHKDNISLSPTKDINVYITAPNFRELEASGACSFISEGTIKGSTIKLDLSGASDCKMNVEADKLEVEASGASEITLSGKAAQFSVDGSGNTAIHGFPLLSEHTTVNISGAGEAEVYASQSLKVDISGAGDVKYKGNPPSIQKDISGAGSVSPVN